MNQEIPDVQAGFRKGRGIRDQIANIHWITEKAREFQKNSYFCFIDYAKALCREIGIPDYLTCLLRNQYTGQEAAVRTRHETMDWSQTGKGVRQGCILSPCLFTSCVMQGWMKHKLEPRLPGEISITSDMQMIPLSWQETRGTKQPLDESERGEWKNWLKTPHSRTFGKIMASDPITSWQMDGATMETVTDFIFLGSKITADSDCSHKIKRCSLEEKLWGT